MANLARYSLLLVADSVIIGCLVHYCLSTLYWHVPTPLGVPHYSLRTRFERLKAYSYVGLVLLSFGFALYGSLIFLFSWMPHRWASYDEDGDPIWIATGLAGMGALAGAVALADGLEKTVDKVSKLRMAEAFEKLIKQEVDQLGAAYPKLTADLLAKLEHQIEAAVNTRTIYIEDARVCRDLLDIFRRMAPPKPATGPQLGRQIRAP